MPKSKKPTETATGALLLELDRSKSEYAPSALARVVDLLTELETRRLTSAKQIETLHELLLFLRAFAGSDAVVAAADRQLFAFGDRPELRRFRRDLEDTGIAGTDLVFPFYWLTVRWLAQRWPEALSIVWAEYRKKKQLKDVLHLLVPYSESTGLDSAILDSRRWLDALRGPDETDAAFLVRRFETLEVETTVREAMYEQLDVPLRLRAGPTTPARAHERWEGARIVLQDAPLPGGRRDLRDGLAASRFRIHDVPPDEGQELIDLANACMVTRLRDLYVFLNADPKDVRIVDFGDGLQFACMGARPDRRLVLESVYGFLTLMNGVPIGYVLCSALGRSSEIAYNVFATYRGVGAAHVYERILAMVQRMFGSDTFAVDPYQLGHKNAEGQASGAWWFYYKLGFRPDDAKVRELVDEELARIAADRSYRTSKSRLNQLASKPMFLELGGSRRDVLGRLDLGGIGLHVSRHLADLGGADREAAVAECVRESRRLLGVRTAGWTADERQAFERWAPLVQTLPGVAGWSAAQKRGLVDVIRAKAGPRESDFVRLFDRHAKLRAALAELGESRPL